MKRFVRRVLFVAVISTIVMLMIGAFGTGAWVSGCMILASILAVVWFSDFEDWAPEPAKPTTARYIGYTSNRDEHMGWGVAPAGVEVENVPPGGRVVKIRSRPDEFIRVYVRRGDAFEAWYCDYTDTTRRKLRLISRVGVNERP